MKTISALLDSQDPIRWLFTGDSITHGAYHTFGARDYVQIFEERVRWEMARVRDHVIRTAVSGYRTGSILDDIDWNIRQYAPHVVSIMIGMNDAAAGRDGLPLFERNYNAILDAIGSRAALIILHTPNPVIPGSDQAREPVLPAIADIVRKIGKKRGLPLTDHHREWQAAWKENPVRIYSWMSDGVHPGTYGHRAFARSTLRTLGMWDDNSLTGRLFIL